MALADGKLQKFFSAQKVGTFDALKQKGKVQNAKSINTTETRPARSDQNESVSEPLSIGEQTVSKEEAIQEQFVSEPLDIRKHLSSNSVATPLADLMSAQLETRAFNPKIDLQLSAYSKKERELLDLIFWQCHNNCSLISPVISTEEIRNTLKISPERVRNLIFRITNKGGLESRMSKSGQNACRIFELSKPLYQNILEDHKRKKNQPLDPLATPLAIGNSSSSNNINTTTLTREWQEINLTPLASIGFSKTQLTQLKDKNNPEIVQESIHHFAYGLDHNSKLKTYSDPLNVLMGVLRKGGSWFEKDYKSPQEIAMQQFLEQKKSQQQREQALREEVTKIEFEEWLASLEPNEKEKISSSFNIPSGLKNSREIVIRSKFMEYFKVHVLNNGA